MLWNSARWWRRATARRQVVTSYVRATLAGTRTADLPKAHARLRANVEPRLRALVADVLGVEPGMLTPQASLADDLAMDSLDVLDVVVRAEAEYGVVFPDRELDGLRTYGDLAAITIALVACRLRALAADREWAGTELRLGAGHGAIPRFVRVLDASPYDRELLREDVRAARASDTIEVSAPPDATPETLAELERTLAAAGVADVAVREHTATGGPSAADTTATLAMRAIPVVGHLYAEREMTLAHLGSGRDGADAELTQRRSETDCSVAELRAVVEGHPDVLRAPAPAVAAGELGRLPELRNAVDRQAVGSKDASAAFTEIADALLGCVYALEGPGAARTRLPPLAMTPRSESRRSSAPAAAPA